MRCCRLHASGNVRRGRGGSIVADAGSLDALVLRAGGELSPSKFVSFAGAASTVTANASSPTEIATVPIGHVDEGTPVRIATHVTASPSSFGVECRLRTTLDVAGKKSPSPLAEQYVTSYMASVALAIRSIATARATGDAVLHVTAACSLDSASPLVALSPAYVVAEPLRR